MQSVSDFCAEGTVLTNTRSKLRHSHSKSQPQCSIRCGFCIFCQLGDSCLCLWSFVIAYYQHTLYLFHTYLRTVTQFVYTFCNLHGSVIKSNQGICQNSFKSHSADCALCQIMLPVTREWKRIGYLDSLTLKLPIHYTTFMRARWSLTAIYLWACPIGFQAEFFSPVEIRPQNSGFLGKGV